MNLTWKNVYHTCMETFAISRTDKKVPEGPGNEYSVYSRGKFKKKKYYLQNYIISLALYQQQTVFEKRLSYQLRRETLV